MNKNCLGKMQINNIINKNKYENYNLVSYDNFNFNFGC